MVERLRGRLPLDAAARLLMAEKRTIRRSLVALAAAALAASLTSAPASALVVLHPGDSTTVSAGTTTPSLPPKLDFLLLMDTTGSMGGEIAAAQSSAGTIVDSIRADSPDPMFAVAGFDDYPYSTYGEPPLDLPYYRATDLTANKTTFQTAANSLATHNGDDIPESQVPALYAAATGLGLSWPGSSIAGAGISFRAEAAHVIALVSDAAFHNDKDGNHPYAGFTAPTYAEALTALADDHARVIAADSGTAGDPPTGTGSQPDMTAIATDTAGTRVAVSGTGVGLSTAILTALDGLDYDVTTAIACEPLQVALTQDSFTAVERETQVSHNATITVPTDVDPQGLPDEAPVDCAVRYTWGDVAIGTFVQQVQVVLASTTTLAGSTARRRIRAAGAVAPNHEGEQVTVDLLRKKRSGNYAVVNTQPATLDSSSALAAKFPRPKPGRCKLTASFDGDAGHDPSSATDKLRC